MTERSPQSLAGAYAQLLADILEPRGVAAEEPAAPPPISELEVQRLWELGLLGQGGTTEDGAELRILDFGEWNRCAGPDFVNAEIEVNGERRRGAIEIDPCAQDWERHGHGADPRYNGVVLHVVLVRPPQGWFTRDSKHRQVPVLYVPQEKVRSVWGVAPPVDAELVPLCRAPLAKLDADRVESLLRAAAAHRMECKRKRFRSKAQVLGASQAWYEAWAETLGYSANKLPMLSLARRAPLHRLGDAAEAILFGTAGFLVSMLPEAATDEARAYHREVWSTWWKYREQYELVPESRPQWSLSGMRPLNHPQRRVAALALWVAHRQQIEPLLNAAGAKRLMRLLTELRHPYWDYHCTLTSAPLASRAALVGRERARDFLVNHVYVQDSSPGAWEAYLQLSGPKPPVRVQRVAEHLFGSRPELEPLLRHHYAQQALLQIAADFCSTEACRSCLFPAQLGQWE